MVFRVLLPSLIRRGCKFVLFVQDLEFIHSALVFVSFRVFFDLSGTEGFPFLIFVILMTTLFERSLLLLFVAIGAIEWLTMARIVRGQVLTLREMEFVVAAEALGQATPRILLGHLLPNVLGPVIVYTTLTVPAVMLLEAVLSFLGLGVQPPDASWGVLISEGAQSMESFPWLLFFPAGFFSLTLFSLNLIGDGLRDALDPRDR